MADKLEKIREEERIEKQKKQKEIYRGIRDRRGEIKNEKGI